MSRKRKRAEKNDRGIPKMKRTQWRQSMFPTTYKGVFWCADCQKESKQICTCKRYCWRWCVDCAKYMFNGHSCEKTEVYTGWDPSMFPTTNEGLYYCGDCEQSGEKFKCDCGKMMWKWCNKCNRYKYRQHTMHFLISSNEEDEKFIHCLDELVDDMKNNIRYNKYDNAKTKMREINKEFNAFMENKQTSL